MRRFPCFAATISLLAGVYCFSRLPRAEAQSGSGDNPTSGRILSIEPEKPTGALKVRQAKGVKPVNAIEGMLVRRGYLLILDPAARATVICGDGKTHTLAPGLQGCPCRMPCTPEICGIHYNDSTIGPTRAADTLTGLFPVIISPRCTMLRNLRPAIRWTPIAGAKADTTYNVTLYGNNMTPLWTRTVISETSLVYPDNESSLTPGQIYKVVVVAGELSSEQDHTPGLGFTTFTTGQARALEARARERKQLRLSEMQSRFLIANLYAAEKLYAEAIEQLEGMYKTVKEPAVAEMLGDLYMAVGLSREAEKSYLEALNMISPADLDGRGMIQKNLASVYAGLGMSDRALARLQEAITAYRRLKNIRMVRTLLKEERALKAAKGHQ